MLSDVASERAVLAGVFQYGFDALNEVADLIGADEFANESNKIIWNCLKHVLRDDDGAKPDYHTVVSASKSIGIPDFFNHPEEVKYLRTLANSFVEQENLRKIAGKLRKLSIARQLQQQLLLAEASLGDLTGDEALETILAMAENPVFEFICKLSDDSQANSQLGIGIDEYIENLINNPVKQIGLSTPFQRWDKAIGGGLRRKTVSVVGARTKVGKSQYSMNVGRYLSIEKNIPVWYGDTELSKEDHWHRNLGALTKINVNDIETGQLKTGDSQKLRSAANKIKNAPYYYQGIAGKPFEETMSLMRRWITKTVGLNENGVVKDCLIIFDYLKLMDSKEIGKQLQEYQVLGFMMTALHNFAVRFDVPILTLVQLNRDGIDSEDTDGVSGSDRIAWLCSNLSILKKQTAEEMAEQIGQERYTHKLVPIATRHGPGLPFGEFIHMKAQYEYGILTEGPTRSELAKQVSQQTQGFIVEDSDDEPIQFGKGEAEDT